MAWSPDGRQLVTSGDALCIWEAATGDLRATLAPPGTFNHVAWSPDGRWIAACMDDGHVRIWDALTGESLHKPAAHARPAVAVAWSPDARQLATVGGGPTLGIWDAAASTQVMSLVADDAPWNGSVAWSPDGRLLTSGGADRTARIWEVFADD